ncbi:MAG: ATP-dependent DNA helicase [Acidobacteria bacterium]|nr:ATP-dependent DNA helicase [Acidobacteriota bacterium]
MQPPAQVLTARQFFARRGILSEWHPNYEFREGQLQMAEAVESALSERKHLVVEAGTGTGKTLAYLIPAILSARKVVISTGTKNLQEQLYYKDVPFLQQHFDNRLRVAYMKGRANYLCRQKVYDADKEPILTGLEEVSDFKIIRDWEQNTQTGDRAELKDLPESSTAWAKLDARRDLCTGQKCPQHERCFVTEMQRRAAEADIVIVNHHLFFADLALKREEHGAVIPAYTAVIFDEAHEIEDVAGQYFGLAVSNYQISELKRDVLATSRRKNLGSTELDRILMTLEEMSERFFALFGQTEGRAGFSGQHAWLVQNQQAFDDLTVALELVSSHLQLIKDAPEEIHPLHRRAREMAHCIRFWMEASDPGFVYWIERRNRTTSLQATPIEVAALLTERLFDEIDTVVLTSATLAVEGGFQFLQQRLGLRAARTLVVPGSFDYPVQALLYVPQHLPDPRSDGFAAAAAQEVLRILEASQGRAFVLFTSFQQMRLVHERVSAFLEYPVLLQGQAPKNALLEQFRATPNCVLFGSASFWQGVDVQGEQLSCVIIDKLPFAVPNDPVVEARIRTIRDSGGNPFFDYQVPQAAIALKQGFGRLIRARTDRGVLVLLDNRITRTRYGQIFFDSLPDYDFTTNLGAVERFFDQRPAQATRL